MMIQKPRRPRVPFYFSDSEKTATDELEAKINTYLLKLMMDKWRKAEEKGFSYGSREESKAALWHEIPWSEIKAMLPPVFGNKTLSMTLHRFKELGWSIETIEERCVRFKPV